MRSDRDYILVTGVPAGLSVVDRASGVKSGLEKAGTTNSNYPHINTSVRNNAEPEWDEENNATSAPTMWLMGGDFQSQAWWNDEEAMKAEFAQRLINEGVKDTPAVINNIEVAIMIKSQANTMLHDDAAAWGEGE